MTRNHARRPSAGRIGGRRRRCARWCDVATLRPSNPPPPPSAAARGRPPRARCADSSPRFFLRKIASLARWKVRAGAMPPEVRVDPDRRAAIVRLLETRDEHLPSLRAGAAAPAGFVSGVRVRSCPDCLANGRVMFGCETCSGRGVVEASRLVRIALTDEWEGQSSKLDPYAVRGVSPFGFDPTRHEQVRERERQIAALGAQTRPPATVDEDA